MLPIHPFTRMFEHQVIHFVHTRFHRVGQSPPANDKFNMVYVNPFLHQRIDDQPLSKVKLMTGILIKGKVFQRMPDGPRKSTGFINVHGKLGGS